MSVSKRRRSSPGYQAMIRGRKASRSNSEAIAQQSLVRGGGVVAQGTPKQVAEEPRSFKGQYPKPMLAKGEQRVSEAGE